MLKTVPHDPRLDLTAAAAVTAMRNGDMTAEDYARTLLDRAKAYAHLNAFRTLEPDRVLEAARAADQRRANGAALGSLHGLPIPVKDSVDTQDLPTSNGTRALKDVRPKEDAAIVARLRAAGALVMGKTNLHELSFGWTSNNDTFGPVHNPYDEARIPGGSSGGSAAAVAARMAPLAVAEDTWASIRLPAAFCGLAGLRPTYGRYPGAGIMALTSMFDQVGPLARTVVDLALFDMAVTGESAPSPVPLNGARIGILRQHFECLDPEVDRVSTAALDRLRDAGAVLVEAPLPEIVRAAPEIAATIIGYEARDSIAAGLERHGNIDFETMFATVGPSVKSVFVDMALPPNRPKPEAFALAFAKRGALAGAVEAYVVQHGLQALVFPAALCVPPLIGAEAVEIAGISVTLSEALARNAALGSCLGAASLVLPAGLTRHALPVGLEFLALPGQDRALLGLGLSLEAALSAAP